MEELEAIRNEILAWQERRFTVLTGSISLVAVLLGFVLSDTKNAWSRQQSLTLLFVVLGCATLVTWYAGRASAARGAYIAVFHEHDNNAARWESASSEFNKLHAVSGKISLNMIVSFIYVIVAVASSVAVSAHCQSDKHGLPRVAFVLATLFLLIGLSFSIFGSYAATNYRAEFAKIKLAMDAKRPNFQ
jgi:hypothetical protein